MLKPATATDIGGIDEVMARISLLLAMDKAAKKCPNTAVDALRVLDGRIRPVLGFLELL